MEEVWKDVINFEGLYLVSSLGRVKSVERKVSSGKNNNSYFTIREKFLMPDTSCHYYRVTLCKDGKTKRLSVHRLVAESFLPNPENKKQVNHIDGDKLNNKLNNLEWVTPSENCAHALKTGLAKPVKGERHGMAKLSESQVIQIRDLYKNTNMTHQEIADMFGLKRKHVSEVIIGASWSSVKVEERLAKKCRKGLKHHNVKINEEIAREIKILIASGNKPKLISEILNISIDIVYDIKSNKTWKYVSI